MISDLGMTSDLGLSSDHGMTSDLGLTADLELTSDLGLTSDPGLTSDLGLTSDPGLTSVCVCCSGLLVNAEYVPWSAMIASLKRSPRFSPKPEVDLQPPRTKRSTEGGLGGYRET